MAPDKSAQPKIPTHKLLISRDHIYLGKISTEPQKLLVNQMYLIHPRNFFPTSKKQHMYPKG